MIGEIKGFTRGTDDGSLVSEVKVDPGGGAVVTAELFQGSGEDAPPLDGDLVALVEGPGEGTKLAVAAFDQKNAGVAAQGERRTIARAPDGTVVAEIWAKASGDIKITSLKVGGKINLNGVEIDQQGNITAPGDVTAKAGSPATSVKLSTHLHPTGTGPSGPPQGGT